MEINCFVYFKFHKSFRIEILKFSGFHFLALTLIFLFSGCERIEMNNPCDPNSKAYQDTTLLIAISGGNTPFCNSKSTNSISITAPLLGYTIKNGATDTFTVKLSTQPTDTVTIPVTVSNTSQASVSPSSLSFTTTNWNTTQTVTVTGIDDLSYGISGSFIVNLGPSVSSDSSASGLTQSSTLSNRDHRKLIFQTNTLSNGNMGGIVGADSICNSDSTKPANTGIYKAMIGTAGIRVASITGNLGDGQIDWVLLPNQLYTRPDGTEIMTTNSVSIFVFGNLTNSIGINATAIWTGISANWTIANGCGANWNDGSGGPFGGYGTPNLNTSNSIADSVWACNNVSNLYCVQQ